MKRREDAILLGLGTSRRKFIIDSIPVGMFVNVPVMKYVAKASGKMCRGEVNHKCLFNKGDIVYVLCPETVREDGLSTVLAHRAWNNSYVMAQRNIHIYEPLLEFKEECALNFQVAQVGHFSYEGHEECLCIQPVPGVNLWIDKRLTLQPEANVIAQVPEDPEDPEDSEDPPYPKLPGDRTTIDSALPADNTQNFYSEASETWGWGYNYPDFYFNDDDDNGFI